MKNLESRIFALENGSPAEITATLSDASHEFEAEIPDEKFGFTRSSATRVYSLLGRSILILVTRILRSGRKKEIKGELNRP